MFIFWKGKKYFWNGHLFFIQHSCKSYFVIFFFLIKKINPFIGCATIELRFASAFSKVLFAVAIGQRPTISRKLHAINILSKLFYTTGHAYRCQLPLPSIHCFFLLP